jgi:hypothetical protein
LHKLKLKGNNMNIAKTLFATALLTLSSAALAGGNFKPKHGGVVQEVGEVQYEVVVKADSVAIYIEDHGKKIDTKGASAKVSFLNGVEKSEATLAPAGENKLEAKGAFNVKSGTKVTAVVGMAGKPAKTVRVFVP